MSENGGTSYVPRSEFEFFRAEFHNLKTENNQRFSDLSNKMDAGFVSLGERFDRLQAGNGNELDKFVKIAGVLLVLAGGVGTLVKMNIDTNVADVGERISTVDKNLSASVGLTNSNLQRLMDNTVPRPELDYKIGTNHDAIKDVNRTQDEHTRQIVAATTEAANLKADVERLKSDIVTRRENEGHWTELSNRVDLLTNRLTDAIKAGGGSSVGDEIRQIRGEFNDFRNKFTQLPKFPVFTPQEQK